MANIPDDLSYRLGLKREYVDQPEGLKTNSRQWTPTLPLDKTTLSRLHKAADVLYDRLIASDVVRQHIDQQTCVFGDDKVRGVIKPFKPTRRYHDVRVIVALLNNMSELASRPTFPLKTGHRDHKYQSVPLNNKVQHQAQLASLLYALVVFDGGWIRMTPGRFVTETAKGLVTRIEPMTPMLDFLTEHRLVPVRLQKTPVKADLDTPVLRVKPEGRAAKAEALLRPVSASEAVLPLLNVDLAKQKLSVHLPDYATYKSYWSYEDHRLKFQMSGKQTLYRQFQGEDGRGGRLYGHFVQQMPAKIRRYLRINRMAVVEVDYSNYHLRILYALAGRKLPEHDAYANMFGERDLFKMVLTKSMGCATAEETKRSIDYALRAANKTDLATGDLLYDTFWSAHEDLCPHKDHSTKAIWPQTNLVDSEIALHVLRLLYDDGICAIPVHDSFIVQDRYRDQLKAAMMLAWSARFPNAEIAMKEIP
ncbi:hypothetical protein [Yoonia vestfoldensis]|uniref:Uncharacterized protein n=1 Tax=Yoonia vestfoldensis TaxID=245188 RepID=A0A1Y0EDK5_9RHOB|nr:hypothetical protein [Yoonia vestfoldensis]ARU01695.1 hypothetical protein LOKVESSMR4R_02391 [Yoonia vestfoldensis]